MAKILVALLAFATLAPAGADESMDAHMRGHFTTATLMQTAVIQADLETLRQQAQWLVQHPAPPDMPIGFSVFLENLHANARAAAAAETLADAAMAVAKTAASCGACHAQGAAQTWLDSDVLPPGGETESQRMARHQWAADRLWEGLIAPSDQAWLNAAEVLLEAPLALTGTRDTEQTMALTERVHSLGQQARSAARSSDRVRIYAEILGTCADCHQRLREQTGKDSPAQG